MGNLKLKENITIEKYKKINTNALICELGFYIGTKKEIDDYIKKNIIIAMDYEYDGYILFYLFCQYVVDVFEQSDVQDIYELIEYNYMKLVAMFKSECCIEE